MACDPSPVSGISPGANKWLSRKIGEGQVFLKNKFVGIASFLEVAAIPTGITESQQRSRKPVTPFRAQLGGLPLVQEKRCHHRPPHRFRSREVPGFAIGRKHIPKLKPRLDT